MPIYSTSTVAKKRIWRDNEVGSDNVRAAVCDEGNGTTNFGLIQAGTVMGELSSGKVRPCGLAEETTGDTATNDVTVADSSNFYVGDTVSVVAGAAQEITIAAGDDGGGGTTDIVVKPKVAGLDLDIVVSGNGTSYSDSYDETNKRITVNSATDVGGAATTTVEELVEALTKTYGHLVEVISYEDKTDILKDVGPTELGNVAGTVIASARTVSANASNVLTLSGATFDTEAGDIVRLDDGWQPAGILMDVLQTKDFTTGSEVGRERHCHLALAGNAKASQCTGLGTKGKKLLAGGIVTDAALSTSALTSKVAGFLFW